MTNRLDRSEKSSLARPMPGAPMVMDLCGRTMANRFTFVFALLLALFCMCRPVLAANFAHNYGGMVGDNFENTGIVADSAGNTYISGHFRGTTATAGGMTFSRIGTQDAFAAKLDAAGNIVWAKSFGYSGASMQANAIAIDASGNAYLGGTLGAATGISVGLKDAFAIKLDASGATTWTKNFGGSGATTEGNAIAVDASGNVYLGGNFGGANLSTLALTKIGIQDAFVIKLDANGTFALAKNFGGNSSYTSGSAIAVDGLGNIILGGTLEASWTTPALTKIGLSDGFFIKFDTSLEVILAKNFGGSAANIFVSAITADASGNIYLGGAFLKANLTSPALTKIGTQDALAIKFAPDGELSWAKNFGGSGATANITAIAVNSSGNVALGGGFYDASLSTPVLERIGNQDALVIKLDASGATTWSKNFGGTGNVHTPASAIAIDNNGNVFVSGQFYGASLTTPVLAKVGTYDMFVIKLDGNGVNAWAKVYSSVKLGASVNISATAIDSAGNMFIVGNFNGVNVTLGGVTLNHINYNDGFAAKLDAGGNVVWANNFGGSSAYMYAQAIAVDASGNVYIGGSFGDGNLTTPALTELGGPNNRTALAIKLDSSGTLVWAQNFGGSGASMIAKAIAVDAAGFVYLGGTLNGHATTPEMTMLGALDGFAIKLAAANGAISWAKHFGGSGASTYINGIAADASGNVTLAGDLYYANASTPPLTVLGETDAIAIKLSAAGDTLWAKSFGGSGAVAYGNAITLDASGNAYLAGSFGNASLSTPALGLIGEYDGFAVKLAAADGATGWAKNFGGSGGNVRTFANAIAADTGGNIYLTGSVNGDMTTPVLTTLDGAEDLFAIKLDGTGATTWSKRFGGNGGSIGKGVAVDTHGNIYLGGTMEGGDLFIPPLSILGHEDGLVIKQATVSVTANYSAGSHGSLTGSTSQSIEYGNDGTPVNAVAEAHYHFVKWSDNVTANPRTDLNVIANLTVSAAFAIDTYLVSFNSNGGSSVTGQNVAYNGNAVLPAAPTKSGFGFAGWYADAGLTSEYNFGSAITAGTTVYAKWLSRSNQTIIFGAQAAKTYGAAPFALNPLATASSALAVSYSALTGTVCSVSGSTVTLLNAGICSVAANQAGNSDFNPAPQVTQSFAVTGTFLATSNSRTGVGKPVKFTATVTGSAPTGSINFTDNGVSIAGCNAVALSAGVATCTTSALTLGAHVIGASYSGGNGNPAGTARTLTQTVLLRAPSIVPMLKLLLLDTPMF